MNLGQLINKEIANIDNILAKKYINAFGITKNEVYCPIDYTAAIWLYTDIETILTNADDIIKTHLDILDEINKSKYRREILDRVNLLKAERGARIRKDFKKALKKVKCGSELSSALGYGFSEVDISNLAKLYKESGETTQNKIIELLEDCNFHTETSDFLEGKTDKYIKGVA